MERADEIITRHEIAELEQAGYVVVTSVGLDALFDEGVNFADYDEGKMRPEPDGYADGVAEVRRRAVARARAAKPLEALPKPGAIANALLALHAAYEPEDPSSLVGMKYPHEGELREIVEAQMVGAQMRVRLAAHLGDVRLTIVTLPLEPT